MVHIARHAVLGPAVLLAAFTCGPVASAADDGPVFPVQIVAVDDEPVAAVVADFDSDGFPDVATINGSPDRESISLIFGIGDGRFGEPGVLEAALIDHGPVAVACGDLDGDTVVDLVVACEISGLLEVVLAGGDGTLSLAPQVPLAGSPRDVVLDDFDGDGVLDLAATIVPFKRVAIALGVGDGTFGPVTYPVTGGEGARRLVCADVNGDELPDLVVAHDVSMDFTVLAGDGRGGFTVGAVLASPATPDTPVLADLDGDRILDLVTTLSTTTPGQQVVVYPGVGDGSFGAWEALVATGILRPTDLVVVDLDGDGDLDLVTGTDAGSPVTWVLAEPAGVFGVPQIRPVGGFPTAVTTADVSGDGALDLIVPLDDTLNEGLSGRDELAIVLSESGTLFGEIPPTPISPSAMDVAYGDVDGDGVLDLVTVKAGVGFKRLSVMLGAGDGTFGAPIDTPVDAFLDGSAIGVHAAHVDGDGDLDAIVLLETNDDIGVFLGQGDGTFGAQTDVPVFADPSRMVSADVDGDGDTDLVIAHEKQANVSVLLGAGDGTFPESTLYAAGAEPSDLVLGDLDGDAVLDLLTANFEGESVSVRLGLGDGTFVVAPDVALADQGRTLALGDLDLDGRLDLAVSTEEAAIFTGDGSIVVLPGMGDGTFGSATTYDFGGDIARWLRIADVDNNGAADVVAMAGGHIRVRLNTGDGGLGDLQTFTPYASPFGELVDIDGNGARDLLLGSSSASVVLNRCDGAPPFVDLGSALAGSNGEPALVGAGTLVGSDPFGLTLTGALEQTTAWLTVGFTELNAPFKGGVLVPSIVPPGFLLALATDAFGGVPLYATWPEGVPAGFVMIFQYWMLDLGGPFGFSASNAVRGTTP